MILGAIADDFAGGTDLAGVLQTSGARTVLLLGDGEVPLGYDAAVVSVKSRGVGAKIASQRAVDALQRLQTARPQQIYFRFCGVSGFAPKGNAGPVTDALLNELGEPFTVVVAADPARGVTQQDGILFVDGVPLPMATVHSSVLRWLQAQTPSRVGLLGLPPVAGTPDVAAARLRAEGVEIAVADVVTDSDLAALAEAFAELPLVAGGSGFGAALPAVWRRRLWCSGAVPFVSFAQQGPALILAGSGSPVTSGQLESLGGLQAAVRVRALLENPEAETGRVLKDVRRQLRQQGYAVVYSSTAEVEHRTAEELETFFGVIASTLVGEVNRLIVSGSDTAAAVADALCIDAAAVGKSIVPGIPVLHPLAGPDCALVLKAGSAGGPDFFRRALDNT